jgi:putative sigma-54 modulation protein
MSLQISGHNIEITPTLHDLITKKFSSIGRHCDQIISTNIVLSVNRASQKAEATLHIPGANLFAKATSTDMYKTIDMLLDKVIRQLEKHKGKSRVISR